MEKPLVSIGVPTFNRPKSLEVTLLSLINQTYNNIEIIISDNCSTDPEVEVILEKFINDPRVRCYKQNRNIGATSNFNFVLNIFSGAYFMRIGDDDWLEPNYIDSCVAFLEGNPNYFCAYGHVKLFNLSQTFVKDDTKFDLDQDFYEERMISFYNNVTQNGIYFGLIRSSCISLVKNRVKLADDWLAVARLCFQGKIKRLDDTYLNLAQGGTGSNVSSIVAALKLSSFHRTFPYLSICLNVYTDILWGSEIYRKLGFIKRIYLAKACSKTIYRRFSVKKEVVGSYKLYLRTVLFSKN